MSLIVLNMAVWACDGNTLIDTGAEPQTDGGSSADMCNALMIIFIAAA